MSNHTDDLGLVHLEVWNVWEALANNDPCTRIIVEDGNDVLTE
ncbi:MAG: hypothetical protein OXC62_17120 [Aestuariivita sp.]|nr:hypothetical protein [Aestuariivita sp.]